MLSFLLSQSSHDIEHIKYKIKFIEELKRIIKYHKYEYISAFYTSLMQYILQSAQVRFQILELAFQELELALEWLLELGLELGWVSV